MAEIYDWNVAASSNNQTPPDGFPEGMDYRQVNDSGRELQAVMARFVQALGAVTTTGTANQYNLAISQTPTALANGMLFAFKAHQNNTGAATFKLNALASVAIKTANDADLIAGEIVNGGLYLVQYDGVSVRLVGSEANSVIKTKYESNANTNAFTDALLSKLNGIEAGATADQTNTEIKTAYEANSDTNAFTDALLSKLNSTEIFTAALLAKLNGIESGATADQTAAEIRSLIAAATDSNVFTDALLSKLNGIQAGATAETTKTARTTANFSTSSTSMVNIGNINNTLTVEPNTNYVLRALIVARRSAGGSGSSFTYLYDLSLPSGSTLNGKLNVSATDRVSTNLIEVSSAFLFRMSHSTHNFTTGPTGGNITPQVNINSGGFTLEIQANSVFILEKID